MPKNDEGEFELVLGNRQLITVFVIVVALLGVFFSFGYIVGRNSSPAATSEAAKTNNETHPAESAPPDTSSPAGPSDPGAQPSASGTRADDSSGPQAAPSVTQPERPAEAPRSTKPALAQKEGKPKPFPGNDASLPHERALPAQLAGGQYWQVVATSRPDAEIIAEALARKGFHAVLAPAPKDGMFRVLVGPLADAPAQAQTRTNLEAAGFKNPIMRKY